MGIEATFHLWIIYELLNTRTTDNWPKNQQWWWQNYTFIKSCNLPNSNNFRCCKYGAVMTIDLLHRRWWCGAEQRVEKSKMLQKHILQELWHLCEVQIPSTVMSLKVCYGFTTAQNFHTLCNTTSLRCQTCYILCRFFFCTADKITRLKFFYSNLAYWSYISRKCSWKEWHRKKRHNFKRTESDPFVCQDVLTHKVYKWQVVQ